MLLPAVQAVREAAGRTACSNNLRQISLANLNFESAHQKFPQGSSLTGPRTPYVPHILPFIEAGNQVATYNFDINFNNHSAADRAAFTSLLSAFQCPSDEQVAWEKVPGEMKGNYGLNWGPWESILTSRLKDKAQRKHRFHRSLLTSSPQFHPSLMEQVTR